MLLCEHCLRALKLTFSLIPHSKVGPQAGPGITLHHIASRGQLCCVLLLLCFQCIRAGAKAIAQRASGHSVSYRSTCCVCCSPLRATMHVCTCWAKHLKASVWGVIIPFCQHFRHCGVSSKSQCMKAGMLWYREHPGDIQALHRRYAQCIICHICEGTDREVCSGMHSAT